MSYKWTIWEGILDTFADDGESIVQIENYLKRLDIQHDRDGIKEILIKMLNEELIEIVYPYRQTKENFISCEKDTIENFWFELTSRGRTEWAKIDSEK